MRQTLQDQERLCGVDEAMADILARRPALEDIATSYSLLLKARLAAQAALPGASLLDEKAMTAALANMASGRPLLDGLFETLATPAPELLARFRTAAGHMLPAAAQAFPNLAADLARVAVRLADTTTAKDTGDSLAAELLAAIGPEPDTATKAGQRTEQRTMEALAAALDLPGPALHMATTETLMAVLAHEATLLGRHVDQGAWQRGYCPVCGGGPDVGLLAGGEKNAPTATLWLHCGQCSALWSFPGMRCPACDCVDPTRLEVLRAEDDTAAAHEGAPCCRDCRTYYPAVKLGEVCGRINLEMLPIGLLHLDLLAQERGLTPVAPSPWNTLA